MENLKIIKKEKKEEKERNDLEGIIQGVLITRPDDTIIYNSVGMEEIMGISSEKMRNSHLLKDVPESILDEIKPHYLVAKKRMKPVFFQEVLHTGQQESKKYYLGTIIPLNYRNQLAGMVISINDITALMNRFNNLEYLQQVIKSNFKDTSDKLGDLSELTRGDSSILENLPVITYRGTLDFIPIFFQGDVEEITGYRETDFILGRPRWDQLIHPEDLEKIINTDNYPLHNIPNFSREREYRIIRNDGQIKWVHEFISNISDKNGKPYLVQGVLHDITANKLSKQEVNHVEKNGQ